jgi:hypothetical protein
VGVEPGAKALALHFANQHHGVRHRAIGAVGIVHAVHCDGRLLQVALPVDAGGIDERLVVGIVVRRRQVLAKEGADRPEIDVDDAVGLRQQPCGFRGSLGAKKDGHGQEHQDRGDH